MKINPSIENSHTLLALHEGELSLEGQFTSSSNATFLVRVHYHEREYLAVYKPQKGENQLWDFPVGTLCKREVAAFVLSEYLRWNLVPPTVFRMKGPFGRGSLQLFVDNDPNRHYFSFDRATRMRLRPVVLFDLLINNADRKGSHILLDDDDHLWLIDHGICFHQEYKLRSVVWDFKGQPIPQRWLKDVRRLNNDLESRTDIHHELQSYLTLAEIQALNYRAKALQQLKTFPYPDEKRRAIPWPPL